ncbi:MAG: SMC-Scp complex subunit ScpB [Candidatus Aenigmarchaeota archaeon]|nr:SMC-Scp complex subunit ScpB [Candidatus Aenigmarchaeota archaeon]
MDEKRALIEAALFMTAEPLTIKQLSKISGIKSDERIVKILDEIKNDLDKDNRGFELVYIGESYQLKVKNKFLSTVSSLTPHSDLSDGMLRTLGVVALKEPVPQSYIIKVQGNKAYDYIKNLEKRGLLKTEKSGRTRLVSTTVEFEKYFGKSINEIKQLLKEVVSVETNEQSGSEISNKKDEETTELENSED